MEVGYKELPLSLMVAAGGMVIWGITVNSLPITVFGIMGFVLFERKDIHNSKQLKDKEDKNE